MLYVKNMGVFTPFFLFNIFKTVSPFSYPVSIVLLSLENIGEKIHCNSAQCKVAIKTEMQSANIETNVEPWLILCFKNFTTLLSLL